MLENFSLVYIATEVAEKAQSVANNTQLLSNIISASIGAVTSIALFALTCLKESPIRKKEVRKERIEKLYFMFYQQCISLKLDKNNFLDLHPIHRSEMDDFLFKNIYLADTETQMIFYKFHALWAEQPDIHMYANEINKYFAELSRALLKEYSTLCHKLKYPKPASLFRK